MIPSIPGAPAQQPAPTGKTCPFASGPVIPPVNAPSQTIEIAGQKRTVAQVAIQLVSTPCVRTCQFFDEESEGCVLADAARVLRQGQREASKALRSFDALGESDIVGGTD